MLDILAATPVLTVFLTVALGTAVGAIPFGPLKFGPAGALFVGLALGAADPRLGEGMELVKTLGLALFVYTVGLAAGHTFFRDLRRQLPLMGVGVVATVFAAALTLVLGVVSILGPALQGGVYAGALTSTPALAAAVTAAGSDEPAVGYALGYPIAVVVGIIIVGLTLNRRFPAANDPAPTATVGLAAATGEVQRATSLRDVPGFAAQRVRMSYLERGNRTQVIGAGDELCPGDRVVVVGGQEDVDAAIAHFGRRLEEHLADDRRAVDFRRFVVSNPKIAGRSVADLDVQGRFHGTITRVRRGDLDLLARDDLTLELGDRVLAVVPQDHLRDVAKFFGDSERKISEVDAFTLGLGMALGLAVGLVTIPLPGGLGFTLGAAAGPLIVGMILGRLERTGPLVWGLPHAANLTTRQLGLMFFLAAVGLSSGQAFAAQAFTPTGAQVVAISIAVVVFSSAVIIGGGRLIGVSATRAAGALAGFLGQPAILAYATTRATDERVEGGYSAVFALCIIVKILLVNLIVGLAV